MELDRDGFTPLYLQLYQLLKEKIHEYPASSALPPERTLCEMFSLDRATVRKALSMLADEKLVERKQGRGTIVLPHANTKSPESDIILFALYHGSQLVDRRGEPFYANSVDCLEDYLRKHNKHLVYSKLNSGNDLAMLCRQIGAAAVIMAGAIDESMIAQCLRLPIPVITYNHRVPGLPSVTADNEYGIGLVVQHLLSLNHKKIGFIHVPEYVNSRTRINTFKQLLREAGLSAPVIAEGNWGEDSGYIAAQSLIAQEPNLTAVFAGNDSMAVGAMRAFRDTGKRIPDDISVIGFDGSAQFSSESLTTICMDLEAMAEAVCMQLFHMLEYEKLSPSIRIVVSGKLEVRASTGPARAL